MGIEYFSYYVLATWRKREMLARNLSSFASKAPYQTRELEGEQKH